MIEVVLQNLLIDKDHRQREAMGGEQTAGRKLVQPTKDSFETFAKMFHYNRAELLEEVLDFHYQQHTGSDHIVSS